MSRFRPLTFLGCVALFALLMAPACGGGGGGSNPPTTPPPPNVVVVEIFDNRFEPKQLTIQPGTTVRWINRGAATDHSTMAMSGSWNSGFVFTGPGTTFEHTFTAADDGETFEYSCVTHKECCMMQGSVRVGESAPPPGPGY